MDHDTRERVADAFLDDDVDEGVRILIDAQKLVTQRELASG
jgi:hypothetical protein